MFSLTLSLLCQVQPEVGGEPIRQIQAKVLPALHESHNACSCNSRSLFHGQVGCLSLLDGSADGFPEKIGNRFT
jgi:hypothetical protein